MVISTLRLPNEAEDETEHVDTRATLFAPAGLGASRQATRIPRITVSFLRWHQVVATSAREKPAARTTLCEAKSGTSSTHLVAGLGSHTWRRVECSWHVRCFGWRVRVHFWHHACFGWGVRVHFYKPLSVTKTTLPVAASASITTIFPREFQNVNLTRH
jgi:hypothetical protein